MYNFAAHSKSNNSKSVLLLCKIIVFVEFLYVKCHLKQQSKFFVFLPVPIQKKNIDVTSTRNSIGSYDKKINWQSRFYKSFQNVDVKLCIFLSKTVINCTGKSSLSISKSIQNYLRSSVGLSQ